MKADETLDFEHYEGTQFHVYGVLLTPTEVFFNEGNRKAIKKSNYLHGNTFKKFIYDIYDEMGLPEPKISEYFGVRRVSF